MSKETGRTSLLHYAVLALIVITLVITAYSTTITITPEISIPEDLAKESDLLELAPKVDLTGMLKEDDLADLARKSDLDEISDELNEIKKALKEISPTPPTFTMQVIPEHIDDAIGGQRCVFLVSVSDEGQEGDKGKPVDISATALGAAVTVNPQAITPEHVAEVTVIPDEVSTSKNLTITILGERDELKYTETVSVRVGEGKYTPFPEEEDELGSLAAEIRDKFIPWLVSNHPELEITSETKWSGTIIRPNIMVVMYYLFFSDEWEMGLTWHVMKEPQNWARIYLRHRFTEVSPSYAFELSSWSMEDYEIRAVNFEDAFAESVWR